ncbi:MAG: TIGR03905 family TSCPD domain-containing protein [Proteobacteria bacterium]|nr:TIGR03905 family TSCPD domain-containing protein [Pseudomonadota bacterium]
MHIEYEPQGVCSKYMSFEIEDGIIKSFSVIGGCRGNLQGIKALIEGMKVEDVIQKLEGIRCGSKGSSCPDQIAKALKSMNNGGVESV